MSAPKIICYQSAAALRAAAPSWDDLWQRSRDVLPCGRAELISDWLEQLAPRANFIALAVQCDGQLVAALPLVQRRFAKILSVGSLPQNYWSWAGDLLVDPAADLPAVLATLTGQFRRLAWPLLRFESVPLASPRWQHLLGALDEGGLHFYQRHRFNIGTVEIADPLARDWNRYEAAWSGNHRRHMRKALRRAQEAGGVQLDKRRPRQVDEVETLLREGFDVEHRSWKGAGGSSVLASPLMWNFFLREAQQLARHGHLALTFLRHQGRAIAFEYGWWSSGVYYTPKVGYDSDYAQFSPGQLLRYLVLKEAFAQTDCKAIDFLGPLSEATAKWATRTYPISSLTVATGKPTSRALLLWVQRAAKWKRALRPSQADHAEFSPVQIDQPVPSALSPVAVEA